MPESKQFKLPESTPPRDAQPRAPWSFQLRLKSFLRRIVPAPLARALDLQPADADSGTEALFHLAPHPVLIQRQGVVLEANCAAAELFGYAEPASMRGLQLRRLCLDQASRDQFDLRQAQADALPMGGQLPHIPYRMEHRSGGLLHARVVTIKDRWRGQEVLISHYFDETATVQTMDALRNSEALMKGIFNASPFAISVSDPATGKLHTVNAAYCRMVGHEEHKLLGRSTHDIGLWVGGSEQRDRVIRSIGSPHNRSQTFFSERLRRSDGQIIHTHGGVTFVGDPDNPQVLFIGTDVTTSLREQAEMRVIMNNVPGCILVTDGPIIRSASPRLKELAGRADLQPVGMNVADLWQDSKAFAEISQEVARQLSTNGRAELVRAHKRPDGSTIQLRLQGNPLPMDSVEGKRSMVWILSDLTAEMAAFRAREVAEASSRAKTDFLAVMSHELRTPLNGVLGLAELARARDTKSAERKEYLNQLADCAHSLADILNDILDLSKIEAGRMELEPRAVDIADFVDRLKSTYTSLAEARGLEFRVTLDAEVPHTLMADPTRLRQVVANFLGNALKFTPEGHIHLQVSAPQQQRLLIEVQDTGRGIPADLLPRLFSPFEQARDIHRNQPAGTGLGLAICRQLARLMGGEVGVSSIGQQGSRFWLDVPLRRPDAQAMAQSLQSQSRREADLQGVRVLLAEDNEINAVITMRALTSAGATAQRVADGSAAVEAVEQAEACGQPFDVVLMDVQMPVMDGLQATRQIRMRACGADIRIVALTAGALAEQREECRQAGMDAHLLKPLHRDRLLQEVLLQAKTRRASAGTETQPGLNFH